MRRVARWLLLYYAITLPLIVMIRGRDWVNKRPAIRDHYSGVGPPGTEY